MPDCPDTREPLLVVLAQSGDRDALEQLLRSVYRPLRGFVTSLVGSSHADDVLQDIALIIFRNLGYLRHPAAFRAWAFRLAARRTFRYLKREKRWARLETDPDVMSSLPAPEPVPEGLEPGLLALVEQVSPASRPYCCFTISSSSLSRKPHSSLTSPLERPSRGWRTGCQSFASFSI